MCGERPAGRQRRREGARALALITLGVAQWGLGELKEAAGSHDEAILTFQRLDRQWELSVARVLRARTAIDANDDRLAEQLLTPPWMTSGPRATAGGQRALAAGA